MDSFNKLVQYFSEFPGIGPRQAKRFVYFLLTRNTSFLNEMAGHMQALKSEILLCPSCFRFFFKEKSKTGVCSICTDAHRDNSLLMIVSRDVDLESIEKTHIYEGLYFVLGGVVPILDKNPEDRVRTKDLIQIVETRAKAGTLKEIIFALNANPEGENTQFVIERLLAPAKLQHSLTFSTLGRGLSTGTELEYSDGDTIKNALQNRRDK